MIRILLFEDKPEAVEVLQIHLNKLSDLGFIAAHYASVSAYLSDQKVGKVSDDEFDVLFLDIELEGSVSGYEFLKSNPHFNKPVVVVSSYPEKYSLEGYKYQVNDFLPKPIGLDDLKQCLLGLSKNGFGMNPGNDRVSLEVGAKSIYLHLSEIIMFQRMGKYSYFFNSDYPPDQLMQENPKYRLRLSLDELERSLPKDRFKRVSKSAIINMDYLFSSNNSRIELQYKDTFGKQHLYDLNVSGKVYKNNFLRAVNSLFFKSRNP